MSSMAAPTPTMTAALQGINNRLDALEAAKEETCIQLAVLAQQITQLEAEVQALKVSASAVPPTTSQVVYYKPEKIFDPDPFTGNKEAASEFILKAEACLLFRKEQYHSDDHKIAYVTSLLKGEAWKWYEPHAKLPYAERPDWVKSWPLFQEEFKSAFSIDEVYNKSRRQSARKVPRHPPWVSHYAR